jgi:Leucine-rich repeat (LRR) protein
LQDISDGTFEGLISKSLEELYITNTWLTRFAAQIAFFPCIPFSKKIHTRSIRIPPSLQALTQLKVLRIEKSNINFIPPGIFDGMSALLDLRITEGQVTEINSATFQGLKNLQKLSLDHNNLS